MSIITENGLSRNVWQGARIYIDTLNMSFIGTLHYDTHYQTYFVRDEDTRRRHYLNDEEIIYIQNSRGDICHYQIKVLA